MKIRNIILITFGIIFVLILLMIFFNHFGLLDFGRPLSVFSENIPSGISASGGMK